MKRLCICRHHSQPLWCVDCKKTPGPEESCNFHKILECGGEECNEKLHLGCISSLKHTSVEAMMEQDHSCILCPWCEHKQRFQNNIEHDQQWNFLTPTIGRKIETVWYYSAY